MDYIKYVLGYYKLIECHTCKKKFYHTCKNENIKYYCSLGCVAPENDINYISKYK